MVIIKKIPLDNFPLSGRPLLGSSGQRFMGGQRRRNSLLNRWGRTELL